MFDAMSNAILLEAYAIHSTIYFDEDVYLSAEKPTPDCHYEEWILSVLENVPVLYSEDDHLMCPYFFKP